MRRDDGRIHNNVLSYVDYEWFLIFLIFFTSTNYFPRDVRLHRALWSITGTGYNNIRTYRDEFKVKENAFFFKSNFQFNKILN